MGTGYTETNDLRDAINAIRCEGGDLAEIGTWQGSTFARLCCHAQRRGCLARGFDSFCGMGEPGPLDDNLYPKGMFDIGGVDGFKKKISGIAPPGSYVLHQGWIPDCLNQFDGPLAFVYVDLDHYEPTKMALPWAWDHLLVGGIFSVDDYDKTIAIGAFTAIAEFLPNVIGKVELIRHSNDQLVMRKMAK